MHLFTFGIVAVCCLVREGRALLETCKHPNMISITYDDGPYNGITNNVLDVLKKEKVKATFFVCGKQLEFSPNVEILKRADKEGHIIASHTYTHADLTKITDEQIVKEMNDTSNAIFAAIKKRPKLMRPPFGNINDRARALLAGMGYQIVGWDIDSHDWDPSRSTEQVQKDVIAQIRKERPGILLMHDLFKSTYVSLTPIIKAFKDNKSNIVPLYKCLDIKEVYFKNYTPMNESNVQNPIDNPQINISNQAGVALGVGEMTTDPMGNGAGDAIRKITGRKVMQFFSIAFSIWIGIVIV